MIKSVLLIFQQYTSCVTFNCVPKVFDLPTSKKPLAQGPSLILTSFVSLNIEPVNHAVGGTYSTNQNQASHRTAATGAAHRQNEIHVDLHIFNQEL